MENNALLISAYTHSKDRIYRKYYVVYNGVYTPVKSESNLPFINDNLKNVVVYAYEELLKVIKGEIALNDLKSTTFKEYKVVYAGA